MAKIFCSNCGAGFEKDEPNCPYCGYISYPGAEEKYMQDLGKIRQNLDDIDNNIVKENKNTVLKYVLIILVIMLVAAINIFIIISTMKKLEDDWYEDHNEGPTAKERLLWENENFPIIDEMYEAGDYDGILEFENELYEKSSPYGIMEYEHADFLMVYRMHKEITEGIAVLDKGDKLSEYNAHSMVYNTLWFYFNYEKDGYYEFTEEEKQLIAGYKAEALDCLFNRLHFTEEEILENESRFKKNGYMDYSKCSDYADKIYERIE